MKDAAEFIQQVLLKKYVQIAAGKAWSHKLFRCVSEQEIMELPEDHRHDFVFSYSYRIPDDLSRIDENELLNVYSDMAWRAEMLSARSAMLKLDPPEVNRYELDLVINHDSPYEYDTYSPYAHELRGSLEEHAFIARRDDLLAMHCHSPKIELSVNPGLNVLMVALKFSWDVSPRHLSHVRKHTGVHKTFKANVQWKPGHPLPGDPLLRCTVGPCDCCK